MLQQLCALRRPFQVMIGVEIGFLLMYFLQQLSIFLTFGTFTPSLADTLQTPIKNMMTIAWVSLAMTYICWVGKAVAYWKFSRTSDELIPTWNIFGRGCWWLLWIGAIFAHVLLPLVFRFVEPTPAVHNFLAWGTWFGFTLVKLETLCLFLFTWQIAGVIKSRVVKVWAMIGVGFSVIPMLYPLLSRFILPICANILCDKAVALLSVNYLNSGLIICSLGTFLTILMRIKRVERVENNMLSL
ncbi:MAG: hypothetical protein Q4C70_14120 [Planctomycetia bacterium]|nr:hypothetical protein [Planctomycetia bacterium]